AKLPSMEPATSRRRELTTRQPRGETPPPSGSVSAASADQRAIVPDDLAGQGMATPHGFRRWNTVEPGGEVAGVEAVAGTRRVDRIGHRRRRNTLAAAR